MAERGSPEGYFNIYVLMNLARYRAAEMRLAPLKDGSEGFAAAAAELLAGAMNVAIPAYHFADQMFVEYARSRPEIVYRTSELRRYRAYLDEFRCKDASSGEAISDLALLGAVADSYKHAEVTKASRPIAAPRAFATIGRLPGETVSRVVVIQERYPKRAFLSIVENVVSMWQQEMIVHKLRAVIDDWGRT